MKRHLKQIQYINLNPDHSKIHGLLWMGENVLIQCLSNTKFYVAQYCLKEIFI